MVNYRRETTGRVITGRMAMRDCGSLAAEAECLLFVFGDKADRGNTHHAAAALAVVQRPLHLPHLLAAQRRQTGVARRAAALQAVHTDQPAIHLVFRKMRPAPLTLRA